ncbi:hypothetical protein RGQ29_031986 [Quercus rubra]|uniref:Uncharacterized protein n=1 Tax=Quercus rubra TaxID=3512 RepID=A0AAN7DT46_QUERU|nr:hypothetical protein RGQ29_031986 [Quercus rubra]
MSTYVRLVGQTIRYAAPCIIPSFYRGEIKKKKKYSDRAADGQAPSCRNGVGRKRLLPHGQLEGAEVRRRAFWLLSYSSTEQHPTAPVLLVVQSVRAPPCQGGSCGFEPRQSRPRIR